jgi:hypothetical protein
MNQFNIILTKNWKKMLQSDAHTACARFDKRLLTIIQKKRTIDLNWSTSIFQPVTYCGLYCKKKVRMQKIEEQS